MRNQDGFTLIEVLAAMVILAVGLLALESLGIGAASAVRRADVKTTYTAVATDEMEQAINELRRTPAVVSDRTRTTDTGARVYRTITTAQVGTTAYKLYTVRVRVLPPTSPTGAIQSMDSVNVVSNVVR
jgi:prepilin-type N-terminal cleavage/methylation domain-containing protein